MILISTEHNGLRHRIGSFQITRYLMSHLADSVRYDDVVVVILIIVDSVFYRMSIDIQLSLCGSPFVTNICCNVYHLVWCQEAIINTLFQTIGIERFAEIGDV